MRLGGAAKFLCTVKNHSDLLEALQFAKTQNIPHKIIGGGSNIIWQDAGFDGLVIVNEMTGFEQLDDTTLRFGSGHNWDEAVAKSVELGLSGMEFLSLIPGTVGATPVQNVGAYGQEISNIMTELTAYDTQTQSTITMTSDECDFGYRTSRFKTTDKDRFIITSVTFRLKQEPPTPPFYESLQTYLDSNHITDFTPDTIRSAVIAIRSAKLPDPTKVANNGSFFANPIVSAEQYKKIFTRYPTVKAWQLPDGTYKLAAGWLIEAAGFNNMQDPETGIATWSKQNLVLVNEHATSTDQLLAFKQKIVQKVQEMFGVTLEQEPEMMS